MSTETGPDAAELRAQLATIKDAMGIAERYPSQFRLWLVYGVLVAVAAFASQVVALQGLPGWYHVLAWGVTMGGGGLYAMLAEEPSEEGTGEGKPSVGLVYGAVFAYAVLAIVLASPGLASLSAARSSATIFALAVGAVGASYLVAGTVLRAYYIRRRDRATLYLGGVWMFALAAAMPFVGVLRTWGYAAFGLCFGVHAVASYWYLARTD